MFKLPTRLQKVVDKDPALAAKTNSLLVDFGSWIRRNELYFFPEYTDHGPTHLEQVLYSIDSLISDSSWQHLTEQDVAAVVTATVLHDSAMHLTWNGFISLISDNFQPPASKFTNSEKPWRLLWDDFFQIATRFDGRTLKRIFGDESVHVERPPREEIRVNEFHRRLIGEFLRRHHARLAHEIALAYVPGSAPPLALPNFDSELKDVFGFIARSHNMRLREAADKIESPRRQTYLGVHAPYCMALLRVADFIQVQAARAPSDALRVKSLISPLSRAEWAKHDAIKFIDSNHSDPESIYIDADPKEPETLNGLRSLFADIQYEIDQSWSVLGEVYGGHYSFRNLGLTLRRIRSSVDDLNKFVKDRSPLFVPGEFRFRTSEADMLKLLVEPLYGRNPAIGIRELIQNAVDATKERWEIDSSLSSHGELPPPVLVELFGDDEKERYRLVISDSGAGMTSEILDNYFLNIGASFRSSDYWKHTFDAGVILPKVSAGQKWNFLVP